MPFVESGAEKRVEDSAWGSHGYVDVAGAMEQREEGG